MTQSTYILAPNSTYWIGFVVCSQARSLDFQKGVLLATPTLNQPHTYYHNNLLPVDPMLWEPNSPNHLSPNRVLQYFLISFRAIFVVIKKFKTRRPLVIFFLQFLKLVDQSIDLGLYHKDLGLSPI